METFISDANINGEIKEGTTLIVKKANKDGSLSVSNGYWTKNEIIQRKNFDKVVKMRVKDFFPKRFANNEICKTQNQRGNPRLLILSR